MVILGGECVVAVTKPRYIGENHILQTAMLRTILARHYCHTALVIHWQVQVSSYYTQWIIMVKPAHFAALPAESILHSRFNNSNHG
jgi:hypothetical protein